MKLPPDGLKNAGKRLELWLIIFLLGTLADEIVKEGYMFDGGDILNLTFSHEKIVVVLGGLLAFAVAYRRVKKKS